MISFKYPGSIYVIRRSTMAFNYEEILFARTEVIAEPIVARVPSQIGKGDARTRLW
jgi:hypothetical protein